MPAQVKKCTCKHDFQDQVYGQGNRLMNEGTKVLTCTVCGKQIK